MRIGTGQHLTYCLNVHAGETWPEQLGAIRDYALPVARLVAGHRPFGLGLRLSAASAAELSADLAGLEQVRGFLRENNLYALTVNAFPYGAFHGTRVKDSVYKPDWSAPERSRYTADAARVLAQLLPAGVVGSISTAPLTFKGWGGWREDASVALARFIEAGRDLQRVREATGSKVVLSMEPEPFCYPESIPEVLEIFAQIPDDLRDSGVLGVCFDTAHHAVGFEGLAGGLRTLRESGVSVGKVQLSAAIAGDLTAAVREELGRYAEPVYLHQAHVRMADGRRLVFDDLAPALAKDALWGGEGEIRVHYHTPLFVEEFGALRSTASELREPAFVAELGSGVTETLEIETYTWHVWREAVGGAMRLVEGVAREFEWFLLG